MDADDSTFSALFDRHRRELQAWRARRFRRDGRWSFRAWLYRIGSFPPSRHFKEDEVNAKEVG